MKMNFYKGKGGNCMKNRKRGWMTFALVGILAMGPNCYFGGQNSVLTVSAHHGHHSGHHNRVVTEYYYCGGHEAHCHENGVCPYDGEVIGAGTEYYYCGGHEAHCHENGVCPYDGEVIGAGTEYYYCGGHEAHCHENGVCPYVNGESGVISDQSSSAGNEKIGGTFYGKEVVAPVSHHVCQSACSMDYVWTRAVSRCRFVNHHMLLFQE